MDQRKLTGGVGPWFTIDSPLGLMALPPNESRTGFDTHSLDEGLE